MDVEGTRIEGRGKDRRADGDGGAGSTRDRVAAVGSHARADALGSRAEGVELGRGYAEAGLGRVSTTDADLPSRSVLCGGDLASGAHG